MIKSPKVVLKLKKAAFNEEIASIYNDCMPGFVNMFQVRFPNLRYEDLEEIYNDSIMALYNNVLSGELTELTCSLQTYINQIGHNKIIDLCRKRHMDMEQLPEYETIELQECVEDYWLAGNSEEEEERKNIIYNIVQKLVEPCKRILYSFYYDHLSLDVIAKMMGLANQSVAKTQKSRCMAKVKRVAQIEFRNNGLN